MNKIPKGKYPDGHTADDFKCFGPPAMNDGQFNGTMLADLGYFSQKDKDSNKYYHGAVVQSTVNSGWYVYTEFGRTQDTSSASNKKTFQFYECNSRSEAESEYCKQMHSKNDKRGEWYDHPTLNKKLLRPKKNKDCYLVRQYNVRSIGLPDAKSIGSVTPKVVASSNNDSQFDEQSNKLMADLSVATTAYTRYSTVGDIIPAQEAIDEARLICDEATKITNKLSAAAWTNSKELEELTYLIFSRIPKKKNPNKHEDKTNWLLTPGNVQLWLDDLDAFEQALQGLGDTTTVQQKHPFHLRWLKPSSKEYKFVTGFFNQATQNRHSWVNGAKIKNIWVVTKESDINKQRKYQEQLKQQNLLIKEKPLHQIVREDIPVITEQSLFESSGTFMLFHGTKTVNVSGILRESLKLPKYISNASITGAMFGGGIYWADDWKKSAGYTSSSRSYWAAGQGGINSRHNFMFIGDVVLGKAFVAPGPRGYTEPPNGHHSVFGKSGSSGVANNEFIVFNSSANNLRYLIEYEDY